MSASHRRTVTYIRECDRRAVQAECTVSEADSHVDRLPLRVSLSRRVQEAPPCQVVTGTISPGVATFQPDDETVTVAFAETFAKAIRALRSYIEWQADGALTWAGGPPTPGDHTITQDDNGSPASGGDL